MSSLGAVTARSVKRGSQLMEHPIATLIAALPIYMLPPSAIGEVMSICCRPGRQALQRVYNSLRGQIDW